MPDCNIHVYIFRYTEHKDLHSSITINPSNEKRAIITEWKNYKKETDTLVGYTTIYLQYIMCWVKIFYIFNFNGFFS